MFRMTGRGSEWLLFFGIICIGKEIYCIKRELDILMSIAPEEYDSYGVLFNNKRET